MRVPLSWLHEFVDVELSTEQLAERLTLLGMEVSAIERIGADWEHVVVGELIEVGPHPGSGRLSLTRVRVPGEPELSIVCGATNIAAGQRVPVALPGALLPGGRRIEVTRIAGAESQGMLCSGDELGLSGDADGILILPPETPLGLAMTDLAGDVVLDVDVKPNRGDVLSIVGLAREVSAATGSTLRWPEVTVVESGDRTADHLHVTVEDPTLCTRFVGRYVEGVTMGPSPWDVQRRLIAAGVRPISNVVDASNYVLLELGKPIHTFDAAGIPGGRIIVRRARPGERLETLDHVTRELDPETLLIAGPDGPLAIAGIMGGAASEVSAGTRDVIIESAIFDPVSVRRSAFRYALRSEASLRFEKGQPHALAELGADRTVQLVLRWAGGRAAVGRVDTQPEQPPAVRVPFRTVRVSRLLGADIPAVEQRALLARVEVATEPATAQDAVRIIEAEAPIVLRPAEVPEALVAVVPAHRRDLRIEADIAEEVARVRGYETIPGRLPDTAMPAWRPEPRRGRDALREVLGGAGLVEIVTHGLIGPDDHLRLGFPAGDAATIRALNPVTVDHSELRRSLLPEHLRVLVDNERQRRPDVHAFEVGTLHGWRDGAPAEREVVGLVLAGRATPLTHDRPSRPVDVAEAKGLLELAAARIAGARLRYEPVTDLREGVEHPGRTAAVVVVAPDGHELHVGRVGEVHPRLLALYEVRATRVVFAELDVAPFLALSARQVRVGPLEQVPGVERDLAFIVAREQPAGDVERLIRESGGPVLRDVRLFDVYRGAPLADEQKSLAYRLRFEPISALTAEDDVDAATERVVAVLSERLGASLRA
jgi:phenylalanyl-tRNA synthetase beta chain